jgi:cytochrome c553
VPRRVTTVKHPFIPDPEVPPDINGVGACAHCHCMGQAEDARHRLPDLLDEAEAERRRYGEREGA